jgi:hypothetical protein
MEIGKEDEREIFLPCPARETIPEKEPATIPEPTPLPAEPVKTPA